LDSSPAWIGWLALIYDYWMERIMIGDVDRPVVVGIDGSDTAINAALWAVDEAVYRNVAMRLVTVMKDHHASGAEYSADLHHAEAALRAAQDAIAAADPSVKVETAIASGLPRVSLLTESDSAAMLCLGSVGIGRYARSIVGSTATELAEKAHCPVAIIRPRSELPRRAVNWIVVATSGDSDDESVVNAAFDEARVRHAPVLMLGAHDAADPPVERWKRRYPGVHAYPIGESSTVAEFLTTHDEGVELAVIGAAEASHVAEILGPHGHSRFHRTVASVLVVRHG
jgi:nucleotide-binding universal stress UspA family protein